MTEPKLIAFTGLKGSGKTTAAQALIVRGFVPVRFAEPLKEMLVAMYVVAGLSQEAIERRMNGDLKEAPCALLLGKTPRYAMQTLGTEWGRDLIHEHLWLALWERRVKQYMKQGFDVVCDDCRFDNEAEAVQMLGGYVGLVDRGLENDDAHSSEKITTRWDFPLENTGTDTEFRRRVIDVVEKEDFG